MKILNVMELKDPDFIDRALDAVEATFGEGALNNIDLDTLDMNDLTQCIVGQLTDQRYTPALEAIYTNFKQDSAAWVGESEFGATFATWTPLWKEQIQKRREAA